MVQASAIVRTAANQLSNGELAGLFVMIALALCAIVLIEHLFDPASVDDNNDQDMTKPDPRDGDG